MASTYTYGFTVQEGVSNSKSIPVESLPTGTLTGKFFVFSKTNRSDARELTGVVGFGQNTINLSFTAAQSVASNFPNYYYITVSSNAGAANEVVNGVAHLMSATTNGDSTTVHLTGPETITGVKTFTVSPIVPNPASATQVANKAYVDSVATGGAVVGSSAWGSITGTLTNQTDLSTALNGKQDTIVAGTTSQYYRGDKAWVTLDKTAVGLANVDNTSDASKPVSSATQTALNAKATDTTVVHLTGAETISGIKTFSASPIVPNPSTGTQAANKSYVDTAVAGASGGAAPVWGGITGTLANQTDLNTALAGKESTIAAGLATQYYRGDKTWAVLDKTSVGLSNVDNTADTAKPVSTAQQSALNAKENTITAGTVTQYWRGDKTWVTLDKTSVGLSSVDNTSDASKPISTATQTALNTKEGTITAGTTAQYWRGDKTWQTLNKTAVGLSNVDNTTDLLKPISTATQTALDLKANLASPTFTGTVSGITKTMVGLGNVDNTSDASKPVSTAQATALAGKADFVIVVTGSEARPAGSGMTIWNDTRVSPTTAPTNMDATNDVWIH